MAPRNLRWAIHLPTPANVTTDSPIVNDIEGVQLPVSSIVLLEWDRGPASLIPLVAPVATEKYEWAILELDAPDDLVANVPTLKLFDEGRNCEVLICARRHLNEYLRLSPTKRADRRLRVD